MYAGAWCCAYPSSAANIHQIHHMFRFYAINHILSICGSFNSLAPGRPKCHFIIVILNLVLLIGIFISSKDNALRWIPRDLTNDKWTLVQVMAWCRQATSLYLSQCRPSSMSPYGIIRPQWVYFVIFVFLITLDTIFVVTFYDNWPVETMPVIHLNYHVTIAA